MTHQEIKELAGHRAVSPWIMKLVNDAVAKEREVVANWIMDRGFATGHGDSIVDLLDQLEWQIVEKEREACAKLCEEYETNNDTADTWLNIVSEVIRARGQA